MIRGEGGTLLNGIHHHLFIRAWGRLVKPQYKDGGEWPSSDHVVTFTLDF